MMKIPLLAAVATGLLAFGQDRGANAQASLASNSPVPPGSVLSLQLSSPLSNAPLFVLADLARGSLPIRSGGMTVATTQIAFSPAIIALADPIGLFGPSLTLPMTDANGAWNLTVPMPCDVGGLVAFVEAYVLDGSGTTAPNGLFLQSNLATVTAPQPTRARLTQITGAFFIGPSTGRFPIWIDGIGPLPAPGGAALNGPFHLDFSDSVDPASLPASGPAVGSLAITRLGGGAPARGRFDVVDDPGFPSGNRRRVIFTPSLPTSPSSPASGGLSPASRYDLRVPHQGASVVLAGCAPLAGTVSTTFMTCDPATQPGGAAGCFLDPLPGPPQVSTTLPPTGASAPVVSVASLNAVSVHLSEGLFPGSFTSTAITLRDISGGGSGSNVAGTAMFFQAGTAQATPNGCRLDFVPSSPLLPSKVYVIVLDPMLVDFGGNPIQPPAGALSFRTGP